MIQDVVLAKNIRVFYGNRSIPWADLINIVKPHRSRHFGRNKISKSRQFLTRAFESVVDLQDRGNGLDIFSATTLDHPLECFDARDRVYGLLGLVNDATNSGSFSS
jgi:hypothetical protein